MAMMWPDRGVIKSTGEDSASLHSLAEQCRSLARGASTAQVASSLREMADGYDARARRAADSERQMERAGADADR